MSTSLPCASKSRDSELDRLRRVVETHISALREGSGGSSPTLGGFRFALLKRDRNTLYRIRDAGEWYLKLPRDPRTTAVTRERIGLTALARVSGQLPGCLEPAEVATNTDLGYVLSSRIEGQPLNRAFYAAALTPMTGGRRAVKSSFEGLGKTLAALHDLPLAPELPPSNRSLADIVSRWPRETASGDELMSAIRTWAAPSPSSETAFVHGNLTMHNVLARSGRISLVDFENCGRGWPYYDLSTFLSHLAVMQCLVWFPRRFATDAAGVLVDAYASRRALEPVSLRWALTAQLAHYYVTQVVAARAIPRVAGIPVAVSRLRRMTADFLSGASSPVPEWKFV